MARTDRDPLAALVHVAELIEIGGQILVGQLPPIECVAVANDEHNTLAMLRRRPCETLFQLLARLDEAIATAWNDPYFIDKINQR